MKLSGANLMMYVRQLPSVFAQREYLIGLGMAEADVMDYLRCINQPLPPTRKQGPERFTETETWKDMQRRFAERMEAARNEPAPEPKERPVMDPGEKFRQIVRVMTGGSDFDGIHQDFPSKAMTFLNREFHSGGYHAALLLGVPGCGKTWAAVAYGATITQAWDNGHRVEYVDSVFVTAPDLFEMIQNRDHYRAALERIKNRRILIIDDLGAEPGGYKGGDFVAFFDGLFDLRYRKKRITIITTNAKKQDIREVYGERFLSRFNEIGLYFESDDADFRRRSA